MNIPQKDLDEFKVIYRREYGVELSDLEAGRIATKVISIFEVICQPLPDSYQSKQKSG